MDIDDRLSTISWGKSFLYKCDKQECQQIRHNKPVKCNKAEKREKEIYKHTHVYDYMCGDTVVCTHEWKH